RGSGMLNRARRTLRHNVVSPSRVDGWRLLDRLLEGVEGASSVLRERVLRRPGGAPFFIVRCVRGLRLGGREDGAEDVVPWDVVHGLRQRIEALLALCNRLATRATCPLPSPASSAKVIRRSCPPAG